MSEDLFEDDDDYATPVYTPDQMDGAMDDGSFHDPRYGNVSTNARPSISYYNESGLPDDVVFRHMNRGGIPTEIASVIEKWSQSLANGSERQTIDMFNRNRWEGGTHPFAVMSQCAWAVENDDILSTAADVVEGLLWNKCHFELYDEDQQDMWNQWAGEVDLDGSLRKIGRELFKVSQVYVGLSWDDRVYAVRNDNVEQIIEEFEIKRKEKEQEKLVEKLEQQKALNPDMGLTVPELPEVQSGPGKGNRTRKKKFPVLVPTAITIFDPTKIMPVGQLLFGKERFAYIATDTEHEAFKRVTRGELVDPAVLQMVEGYYKPTKEDEAACASVKVDHNRLWLLRENTVFRHTLTRADYERWAPVRLKPALEIMEMKQHLKAADRATLIGNTNFIVLITKGSDKLPAKPAEIENLQAQAKIIARLPVLVGDHRLDVKIVSPSTDNTLIESRYQVLDSRLVFMALRSYTPIVQGGNSSGAGVSEMSRVVSRGLESRRAMVVRSLEKRIFKKILEANSDVLDEDPSLEFTPKRISLDFNADVIANILKLRDRGDLSRETMLEEVDFDQEIEVRRRAREGALYDDVFNSQVPHGSPATNPFGAFGALAPPPPGAPGSPHAGLPGGYAGGGSGSGSNVGPSGQPRTEGGRPRGATDTKPRATKNTPKK